MYIITKDNRPQGNKKFLTYEEARQTVRKWIRKNAAHWAFFTSGNNPTINVLGYQIKRV
jgi:hypothetical protein